MRNEPGVYALVMQLETEQTIVFNKKGAEERFLQGWYIYVGSARGIGGVKTRTNKHLQTTETGKRLWWNVDYIREHSTIHEIWYSYTKSAQLEHHWAKTIQGIVNSSVPVPKFGASDCTEGCDAHFFYFPDRPLPINFRSSLSKKYSRAPEVFVELIEDETDGMIEQ